jgi:hypothetical protein
MGPPGLDGQRGPRGPRGHQSPAGPAGAAGTSAGTSTGGSSGGGHGLAPATNERQQACIDTYKGTLSNAQINQYRAPGGILYLGPWVSTDETTRR